MDIIDALRQPCLVDTSLLTNFLFSGNALLLNQLLGQPMQITPAILDPAEVELIDSHTEACASEALHPLFASEEKQERYKNIKTHIMSFAKASGTMWNGVDLSPDEYALALSFRDKAIWNKCPSGTRKRKKGLGAGEAEVLAVAISRKWTVLLDDQAAVDLLRCLAPDLPVLRTCALLVESVHRKLIVCKSAEHLFNEQICNELLFNCKDPDSGKFLRFRCDPPRCQWESL